MTELPRLFLRIFFKFAEMRIFLFIMLVSNVCMEKRAAVRTHLNEMLPSYIARADAARKALEELAKA